jgi:hypothetical protein
MRGGENAGRNINLIHKSISRNGKPIIWCWWKKCREEMLTVFSNNSREQDRCLHHNGVLFPFTLSWRTGFIYNGMICNYPCCFIFLPIHSVYLSQLPAHLYYFLQYLFQNSPTPRSLSDQITSLSLCLW